MMRVAIAKYVFHSPNCPVLIQRTIFLLTCILSFLSSRGQERCGTVPYNKSLQQKNVLLEQNEQFENWLREKIRLRRSQFRTQAGPYKIPVVVHVIHKGEPVGTGANISNEQILSQIKVLNDDFTRQNADASNTSPLFLSVAGSMDIEFVMAKRDPGGFPTDGIVRKQGSQNVWGINDNYQLKAQSYWPAEDYMNIWVTDMAGDYLGYAQFPVSDLAGLENSSSNRLTDGVVIDYRSFGSIDEGDFDLDPSFNKGRTATHEVGHFFGLRHIWGDDEGEGDGCGGSDYVDDTPNQAGKTTSCPTQDKISCGVTNMFQNFLDYTNDNCMNIFTQGQVQRMSTVIENSPRRKSLLTSPALLPPAPFANDLGIQAIISPKSKECDNTVTPAIEIKNYGDNTITSAQIRVTRNGWPDDVKVFTVDLEPSMDTIVSFDEQIIGDASYAFTFDILQTNGVADGNPNNNSASVTTAMPEMIDVPFDQPFESLPADWEIQNPDNNITWQQRTAPNHSPANQAVFMNFYDYEDNFGEIDVLLTPVFDLSDDTVAYLTFDVAYAQYQGSADGLKVYVLTDCNTDLFSGVEVFSEFGSALSSGKSMGTRFVPAGPEDWSNKFIDLVHYIGLERVQLAFVGFNDWGNNLYLDNISFSNTAEENLVLKSVIDPQPVRCEKEVTPKILVHNRGLIPVTSLTATYTADGGIVVSQRFDGLNLTASEDITLTLPSITLPNDVNNLSFSLTRPNDKVDVDPKDNEVNLQVVVNNATDRIPLREDFSNFGDGQWTVTNPNYGLSWAPVNTNFGQSIYFNSYDNTFIGDRAWLLSPTLDFSTATTASMFFDISYAKRGDRNEILQVLASTNCGMTFENVVFNSQDTSLAITAADNAWLPSAASDWKRQYVNLNQVAGKNNVRFAFVLSNANGNNLYIDNIEFYRSDNPLPREIGTEQYQIYGTLPTDAGDFYLTFNLNERMPVTYQVIDVMGKLLVDAELPDVLNQTFLIDAGNTKPGIYIVRLKIGHEYHATKLFLSR